VIGTGAYGKVFLVMKKDSERLFAMKVLKKKQI
jgi:serine/threonine protein kinase